MNQAGPRDDEIDRYLKVQQLVYAGGVKVELSRCAGRGEERGRGEHADDGLG